MTWLGKIRLRVFAYLVGLGLAVIGVLSFTALPALPIVGVAIAAAAVLVNHAATRLSSSTCLGCGESIARLPSGEHGTICPTCGTLSFGKGDRRDEAGVG